MATTKARINISVSPDVERALKGVARRDRIPTATKAAQLLRLALEIEEDRVLDAIATERDTPNAKFISHEKAWK